MELRILRTKGKVKEIFEVVKNANGKYTIDKIVPCLRTNATVYNEVLLWLPQEEFNTEIEASDYMKTNIWNFL